MHTLEIVEEKTLGKHFAPLYNVELSSNINIIFETTENVVTSETSNLNTR